MHYLLALLTFLSLTGLALARPWYAPTHQGKRFVNPSLTPQRAWREARPDWQDQLVLWSGRLRQVKPHGSGWRMQLETTQGLIAVECPRPVLTLKANPREGCLVAIKGEVQFQEGHLHRLLGRSVILLDPPQPLAVKTREEFLSRWIAFHWPKESAPFTHKLARTILEEAQRNQLDPWYFASLLQIESAFCKDVVSSSGAIGMGQLMPFTAEGLSVDPWDSQQNVAGSARMLAGLLQGWSGEVDPRALALACYNAGPSLVRQLQRVPAIPETNNYVYFIGFLQQHHQRRGL